LAKKVVVIGMVAAVGTGIIVAIAYWTMTDDHPNPPQGVRCYVKTERVPVSPTDEDEWKKPGYQVTQFAKLKTGEIVAPILRVDRPNFSGFMGGVRHDPVWEETYHAMGEGQAKLDLPIDDGIESYVVLIRRIPANENPELDPWRVWTFDQQDVSRGLLMPRFSKLELFANRKDANDLLQKDRMAKEFAMELRK
jgi:hypothetical protein